jgi:hypothetical protein
VKKNSKGAEVSFIWRRVDRASFYYKITRLRPLVLSGRSSIKIKLYEEEGFKMVDWSGLRLGPLNFDFWLVLKSVNWKIILVAFNFTASGSILINFNQEGCVFSVFLLTEKHL